MEEEKTIHFELLGAFSCRESQAGERRYTTAGRKALSFLQYLIVNHSRAVSMEELIGLFWADVSSAPANALKNMVYKSRNLLKTMLPDQGEL